MINIKNIKDIVFLIMMMAILNCCVVTEGAKRKVTELPEVLVESQQRNMLHVLAYVREFSTLTTFSDTVTLFREKTVDFMLPGSKTKYRGWKIPRVLKSESYYRFTDANGLDSVSDTSRHHFSWSDWMGLPPIVKIPESFMAHSSHTDTIFGKFSPTEIWTKNKDLFSIELNVLADTLTRKWVPTLKSFFTDERIEFEDFKMKFDYANVLGKMLTQRDLLRYTFHVDSRGRGHSMFRFNRRDEDFFATTDGEVYMLDMEYITEKEARKWGKGKYDRDQLEILCPLDAPPLSKDVLALIDRVEHIDKNLVRLDFVPDKRMMRKERNRSKAGEALRYLKNILGISDLNAGRTREKNWRNFRNDVRNRGK